MIKRALSKFTNDPLGLIKRVLDKTVIGRLKYGRGDDYDAARYWRDRFARYGESLRAVGDEGLSEDDNERMYKEGADIFAGLCRREGIDVAKMNVLEIGCGTGFYTQVLNKLGVRRYTGIDITDRFFPGLMKRFPRFTFSRKDVSSEEIGGRFDLIVMIDVVEHIVNRSKFAFAMENIKRPLSEGGVLILAPIMKVSRRPLFHLRTYSADDIREYFPGYDFGEPVPFRCGHIVAIKRRIKTDGI